MQIGSVHRISVEQYYLDMLLQYDSAFKPENKIVSEMQVRQDYVDYIYSDQFKNDFERAYNDILEKRNGLVDILIQLQEAMNQEKKTISWTEESRFPIFINYDKQDDISDTTKYEDHFVGYNRLIAISKSGRTLDSEDVQNFLHAKERGIDVQLFVRKNKDDKISKEFYYLGRVNATGQVKEFVMPNTDKTAVEIEWVLDTPVREDIYEYIVNG